MKWIPLTERLPRIPEIVWVSDGHNEYEAYIWDREDGGVYFEVLRAENFTPLYWRPKEGSAIELDFERNTRRITGALMGNLPPSFHGDRPK